MYILEYNSLQHKNRLDEKMFRKKVQQVNIFCGDDFHLISSIYDRSIVTIAVIS